MTDMTLFSSQASPYARKTRVVAEELGLSSRIRVVRAQPRSDVTFHSINPARRIPALQLANGTVLVDSRVICEYFDHLAGGAKLFPTAGAIRWESITLQALGDALCDWAVPLRNETLRPQAQQSSDFIERAHAAILGIVDSLFDRINACQKMTIGTFSVACALEYLDFRFPSNQPVGRSHLRTAPAVTSDNSQYRIPGIDWRIGHEQLASWLAEVSARPSMRITDPRLEQTPG